MNTAQLSLTIKLERDDALGTLETMLATARRGGLQLEHLRLQQRADGANVELAVSADDSERLALFTTRLGNVIGVIDVGGTQASPCMYIA